MPRKFTILILALLGAAFLFAQEADTSPPTIEDLQMQLQAMSDSLLQFREQEIYSEYGFRDTDKLEDVAAKLQIANIAQWKSYLEIEPENEVLDKMSLRQLGISPYRAFLAQQYSIHGFTELSTLSELATQKQLPIKKLRQFAGIESTDKSYDNHSLQALGKQTEDMVEFEETFNENRIGFGLSITAVGVLMVFSALAITALVISQLRHLNRKPKQANRTLVLDAKGNIVARPRDMNSDVIAALITALHLHKQSIEDRRRLLLTFRRAHSDQWRSSAVLNMPNRDILRKRSR